MQHLEMAIGSNGDVGGEGIRADTGLNVKEGGRDQRRGLAPP
jgi:hypothetical protein